MPAPAAACGRGAGPRSGGRADPARRLRSAISLRQASARRKAEVRLDVLSARHERRRACRAGGRVGRGSRTAQWRSRRTPRGGCVAISLRQASERRKCPRRRPRAAAAADRAKISFLHGGKRAASSSRTMPAPAARVGAAAGPRGGGRAGPRAAAASSVRLHGGKRSGKGSRAARTRARCPSSVLRLPSAARLRTRTARPAPPTRPGRGPRPAAAVGSGGAPPAAAARPRRPPVSAAHPSLPAPAPAPRARPAGGRKDGEKGRPRAAGTAVHPAGGIRIGAKSFLCLPSPIGQSPPPPGWPARALRYRPPRRLMPRVPSSNTSRFSTNPSNPVGKPVAYWSTVRGAEWSYITLPF